MKQPSIIKKVSYRSLVEELWRTPISDDPEEDAVLKKIIATCNYGMLEKQTNRTQTQDEWLMICVGKSCGSCGDCLTDNRSHGRINCNATAQRVCNNEAHHLDNVITYCVYCNTVMSNR